MEYLPIKPQWAPEARERVAESLSKEKVVLEWGNGCSTAWLAPRCKFVFAIDDDKNWSDRAKKLCAEAGHSLNVDFTVYPEHDYRYSASIFYFSELLPIDIAIVDGVSRMECFNKAVKYVKKGGLIVLDDSQRDEYKQAFRFKELEVVWTVGSEQTTTMFRKV